MKPLILLLAAALIGLSVPGPAHAVNPSEMLADPLLEKRAREISKELRCVVCQNQSIHDSDAPLARDLRVLVRERLLQGESDSEVIEYVVASYGDFVLLRPPFKATTIALWVGPGLLMGFGVLATVLYIRRRSDADVSAVPPADLSEADRKRLDALLKDDDAGRGSS